jgi:Cd(II)/Pb(II)-responsive transcriptional regulator
MKIGALAKLSGTQPETVRYYEREGLMPAAARTGGNYRDYGEEHHRRLAFIRHCRTLGISLAEVRSLLDYKDTPDSTCEGVDALIARHLDETSRRIRELQQLQDDLQALRARCSRGRSTTRCGILGGIERAALSC